MWAAQDRPHTSDVVDVQTNARARGAGSDGRPGAAPKSKPELTGHGVELGAQIRAADDAVADGCPRHCDQGWLTHPDGTVTRCDHTTDGSTP
jgi:hypothetical protein